MTALATDAPLVQELGDVNELPVKGSTKIYEGAAVCVDANGLIVNLVAGLRFAGFALRQADNTSGADSAINVRIQERGKVVKTITGVAEASVGAAVYATDNDAYTMTPSGVYVGRLWRIDGSNLGVIYYNGFPSFGTSAGVVADYAVDSAIAIQDGTVLLSKPSAGAYTLAAPTAGSDDGKRLIITAKTAFAHTVTQTTPGFNGGSTASDVATFGGAIGDSMTIVAVNGKWNVVSLRNVTLG